MNSQRIRVFVPTPIEAPRGAEWAASMVVWIWHGALRGGRLLRRPATVPTRGDPVDRVRIPR